MNKIIKATHLGYYKLCVEFSDGETRNIDLFPFIKGRPHLEAYLNIDKFRQFEIDSTGVLTWANDWDLNPHAIYAGVYDNREGGTCQK